MRAFLLQPTLDQAVASLDHLMDEPGVIVAGVEIPAAPQDEGLVDGVLEAVVALLGDAVLVAPAPIDTGGSESVMVQQGGVGVIEIPAAATAHFVGRGGGIVAAYHLGDASQSPQRGLQSLLQRQEGLADSDLGVTPPRVAEYQMEELVVVRLTGDGHRQGVAMGEGLSGLPVPVDAPGESTPPGQDR